MKLNIFITNADRFLSGDYKYCFGASECDDFGDWIKCGTVEVELDVDEKQIRQAGADIIDEKIKETRAEFEVKMQMLEGKKQSLMSIEHNPETTNDI